MTVLIIYEMLKKKKVTMDGFGLAQLQLYQS
jgi:hypothetical protein